MNVTKDLSLKLGTGHCLQRVCGAAVTGDVFTVTLQARKNISEAPGEEQPSALLALHLRVTEPQGRDSSLPCSLCAPQHGRRFPVPPKAAPPAERSITERKKQAYSGYEVLGIVREADVSHGTLRELEFLADGLKGNCIKDVNASISKTSSQKMAWKAEQKPLTTPSLLPGRPMLGTQGGHRAGIPSGS